MLTFRPLVPADRPAMEVLCAAVWDGDDYVPHVFDDWVQAPDGWFTAALDGDELVGLARLARLAPGEYWLQGIRVHAARRGQGIAAALHTHLLDFWRRIGEPGTLRLVTDSDNQAIIRLCERTGFSRVLEYTVVGAPAEAGPHHFCILGPDDAARAFEQCARAPRYAEQHGLVDTHWKWQSLTPAFLSGRARAGRLYGWGDAQAVLVAGGAADPDPQQARLRLEFAGVESAGRPDFLRQASALAHELGRSKVRWCTPVHPELEAELAAAGYARLWDGTQLCFEAHQ